MRRTTQLSRRIQLAVITASFLVLASACGRTPGRAPAEGAPAACTLLPPPRQSVPALTVGSAQEIDPTHAPDPRNASERLLFAHLYETLVQVDCTGQPRPGLARRWSTDTTGRRWTFELREDARFWDGTPVTAREVVAGWRARAARSGAAPDRYAATGERLVTIELPERSDELPLALASPRWAVASPGMHAAWPRGTGTYRVDPAGSSREVITLRPTTGQGTSPLRFRIAPGADGRDLLDSGVDVLVTGDPSVLDYAKTRAHLTTIALPWEHSYVLLLPSRARGLVASDTAAGPMSSAARSLREALARDALQGEARASAPPFWWGELGSCVLPVPAPTADDGPAGAALSLRPRIVFSRADRRARGLAERLAALAGFGRAGSLGSAALAGAVPELVEHDVRVSAIGVAEDELERLLRAGADLAYLVALPQRPMAPCDEMRALISAAGWVAREAGRARPLVPLVDTRAHLVVRRDAVGAIIDRSGTPHLVGRTEVP